MYHHVIPFSIELSITPENFESQILEMKRKGWKALDSQEFSYLIEHPKESRKKCIVITFDDGFLDNYLYAYPILKKYKMKAILFAATGFISDIELKRNDFKILSHKQMWEIAHTERRHEVMCTWSELKEMESEGVFDIQSHGHSHNIPDFIKTKDYKSVREDLELSKALILKHLNKTPSHLAWPKGAYDNKTVDLAKELGFKILYTTQRGANLDDYSYVKRIAVKNKGKGWLNKKLIIYSSFQLTKIYHSVRIG